MCVIYFVFRYNEKTNYMHELCRLSLNIFRKPWLVTSPSPKPLIETWLKKWNLPYIEESYFLLCNVWIRNNHDNVRPLVIIMFCEEKLERCWCKLCEKISKPARYNYAGYIFSFEYSLHEYSMIYHKERMLSFL